MGRPRKINNVVNDTEIKSDVIAPRKKILLDAINCVCGNREQDYGSPEDNFGIIANLWSDYLGIGVTSIDVSMMMILLKVARIRNGGGTGDSFVDIAGYAACGGEILNGTNKI